MPITLAVNGSREPAIHDEHSSCTLDLDRYVYARAKREAEEDLRREVDEQQQRGEPGHLAEMIGRLMRVTVARNTTLEVRSAEESGRTCVWLEELIVDMTPASVEIFVPSDYPDGSCEYDAILVHEKEQIMSSFKRELTQS